VIGLRLKLNIKFEASAAKSYTGSGGQSRPTTRMDARTRPQRCREMKRISTNDVREELHALIELGYASKDPAKMYK
jgi:hypothetical protein